MNIELNDYGFILDSSFSYIAINWITLITLTALFIGFKVYKRIKAAN